MTNTILDTMPDTMPDTIKIQAKRSEWIRLLSALPSSQIKALAEASTQDCQIRHKTLPQSGLGMLKMQDTAFHEPFYLGEFPLASSWVEVTLADGSVAEGAANVMDDDSDLAVALAICDGVLANQLPNWESIADALQEGQILCDKEARIRKAMLASTQVDFSLLNSTDMEDDGDDGNE